MLPTPQRFPGQHTNLSKSFGLAILAWSSINPYDYCPLHCSIVCISHLWITMHQEMFNVSSLVSSSCPSVLDLFLLFEWWGMDFAIYHKDATALQGLQGTRNTNTSYPAVSQTSHRGFESSL